MSFRSARATKFVGSCASIKTDSLKTEQNQTKHKVKYNSQAKTENKNNGSLRSIVNSWPSVQSNGPITCPGNALL